MGEERKQEADAKMNRLSMMSCEEHEADLEEEERPSPEVRIKTPAANTNIIEVRYRERNSTEGLYRGQNGDQERRRSRHVNRLQITKVLKEQPVISLQFLLLVMDPTYCSSSAVTRF